MLPLQTLSSPPTLVDILRPNLWKVLWSPSAAMLLTLSCNQEAVIFIGKTGLDLLTDVTECDTWWKMCWYWWLLVKTESWRQVDKRTLEKWQTQQANQVSQTGNVKMSLLTFPELVFNTAWMLSQNGSDVGLLVLLVLLFLCSNSVVFHLLYKQLSALMEKIDPLWTLLHTRFCPVAVFKLVFNVLNWFFLSWALTALLSAELLFPDGLSVDHRADFRCFNGPIIATCLPPGWSSTPDRPPHLQRTCSFSEIS